MSIGKLTEQHFSKEVLKTSGLSDNFEVFGTMAENIFRVGETAKMSRGTAQSKSFLKRKSFAYSDSERFSYFWRKTLTDLGNPQSTYTWKFLGKNIFWNLNNLPHLFGLWSKNAQSENFFTSCHNCNPRVQRQFLIKSYFSRKSYICSSVLEFEHFFCLLTKKI